MIKQTMPKIWDAEYAVGHPDLDRQNRHFLAICRRLDNCADNSQQDSVGQFHEILNDLVVYVSDHFCEEERLLSRCAYPALSEQREAHQMFKERLTEFLLAATVGVIDRSGLQEFLAQWWRSHIQEADKQYAEFFRQSPVDEMAENRKPS